MSKEEEDDPEHEWQKMSDTGTSQKKKNYFTYTYLPATPVFSNPTDVSIIRIVFIIVIFFIAE
jgi:hypothetical protein